MIVQSDRLNLSTVLVAPTSAHARPARHRALVDIDDVHTHVLAEQIHAIDLEQLGPRVARLSPEAMADVRDAMRYVFDF